MDPLNALLPLLGIAASWRYGALQDVAGQEGREAWVARPGTATVTAKDTQIPVLAAQAVEQARTVYARAKLLAGGHRVLSRVSCRVWSVAGVSFSQREMCKPADKADMSGTCPSLSADRTADGHGHPL